MDPEQERRRRAARNLFGTVVDKNELQQQKQEAER
jgi:hypothetical protein